MVNNISMTDDTLVKAYTEGSNDAFNTLLKRHKDRVFSYIMRIVKTRMWQTTSSKRRL